MPARALMFQGTGSDVGKSLIVAGLARALTLRGIKVRPFKPQNMSNNAAVTMDGGEIGRAQALQARAARAAASVHMNPVLLKPQSEIGAQIVVQGGVYGSAKAATYQKIKPELLPFVLDSYARMKAEADIVLIEGAGSAAEINLRGNDIANMGFARAADVPVVLEAHIGDVVAAQIYFGGAAGTFDQHDVGLGFHARITIEHERQQLGLHFLIGGGFGAAVDAALHHDLRADLALRLQQHRIHVHARRRAGRARLQRLSATDLAAVRRHRRIVRHVLRLERTNLYSAQREGARQPGDDQRFADVRAGALE